MNLSADDVRSYLTAQIDRLGNKRLKVGSVNADSGNIIAEVVTVDNSLVQRMKVDRSIDRLASYSPMRVKHRGLSVGISRGNRRVRFTPRKRTRATQKEGPTSGHNLSHSNP